MPTTSKDQNGLLAKSFRAILLVAAGCVAAVFGVLQIASALEAVVVDRANQHFGLATVLMSLIVLGLGLVALTVSAVAFFFALGLKRHRQLP